MNRDIVVIGASAGGFDAIKNLIYNLPHELGISVFIVWHISPHVRGVLPQLLDTHSKYPAAHAADGEQIETNRIYVAPPDHHL
jgi:two-component system chemotaxis response regulator CheB